jgi:hypothetical protein
MEVYNDGITDFLHKKYGNKVVFNPILVAKEYHDDVIMGKLVGYDTLEEAIEALRLIIKEEEQ